MDAASESEGRPTGHTTGPALTRRRRLLLKAVETPWTMAAFTVVIAVLGVLRLREGRWQIGLLLLASALVAAVGVWQMHTERAKRR